MCERKCVCVRERVCERVTERMGKVCVCDRKEIKAFEVDFFCRPQKSDIFFFGSEYLKNQNDFFFRYLKL